jgi:hypothetical protein
MGLSLAARLRGIRGTMAMINATIYLEMETINEKYNTCFTHDSYMFRLPQCSDYQAVHKIIRRKLFTYKLWAEILPITYV